MESDPPQTPERVQTDESLRLERKNTDALIASRREHVEDDADAVLARARSQAAELLESARDRADAALETAGTPAPVQRAVDLERLREDKSIADQHAAADATLERERLEQKRTLATLLPLERDKTDRYLLTERRRSDDALAHRDDFMGMVSHDVRNLLSGIVLTAEALVEASSSSSEEGKRAAAAAVRIQRYVARTSRLIGDLVDVVSVDAGKLRVSPEKGDVALLADEAVDAFGVLALAQGIALDRDTGGDGVDGLRPVLSARFDHDRMVQVLANLITNAVKFTPRGGRIRVRAYREADDVRLSVADNGVGIAADKLDQVFERFWQVGANDRRGLGLGLYIARCIMDAHHGRIWVESALGAGTTVHVILPATG